MRSRAAGNSRKRRLGAAASVAFVAAAPFFVFRGILEDAATDFRWEFVYLLSGWTPFVLMILGALWFVPVVLSIDRTGYSRLYVKPVTRHACQAWGLVTYLLGFMLAVQTSQIAGLF